MIRKLDERTINLNKSQPYAQNVFLIVKELIENSLDAEATEIQVKIRDDEILVSDNGKGICNLSLVAREGFTSKQEMTYKIIHSFQRESETALFPNNGQEVPKHDLIDDQMGLSKKMSIYSQESESILINNYKQKQIHKAGINRRRVEEGHHNESATFSDLPQEDINFRKYHLNTHKTESAQSESFSKQRDSRSSFGTPIIESLSNFGDHSVNAISVIETPEKTEKELFPKKITSLHAEEVPQESFDHMFPKCEHNKKKFGSLASYPSPTSPENKRVKTSSFLESKSRKLESLSSFQPRLQNVNQKWTQDSLLSSSAINSDSACQSFYLGFRGQALFTIRQISSLKISTRTEDSPIAHELCFDTNKMTKCARNIGTTVTVKNLFQHCDIRKSENRKNLKKYIVMILSLLRGFCLSYNVRFILKYKKVTYTEIGTGSVIQYLENRFYDLFDVGKHAVIDNEKYTLYVSAIGHTNKSCQFVIHRKRPIACKRLINLLNQTFKKLQMHGYFGFVVILKKDGDVNIHVDKSEVVFFDESQVFREISIDIERFLSQHYIPSNIKHSQRLESRSSITQTSEQKPLESVPYYVSKENCNPDSSASYDREKKVTNTDSPSQEANLASSARQFNLEAHQNSEILERNKKNTSVSVECREKTGSITLEDSERNFNACGLISPQNHVHNTQHIFQKNQDVFVRPSSRISSFLTVKLSNPPESPNHRNSHFQEKPHYSSNADQNLFHLNPYTKEHDSRPVSLNQDQNFSNKPFSVNYTCQSKIHVEESDSSNIKNVEILNISENQVESNQINLELANGGFLDNLNLHVKNTGKNTSNFYAQENTNMIHSDWLTNVERNRIIKNTFTEIRKHAEHRGENSDAENTQSVPMIANILQSKEKLDPFVRQDLYDRQDGIKTHQPNYAGPFEFKTTNNNLQSDILILKEDITRLEVLGQFNKGFILTKLVKDDQTSIIIVDQHAADEIRKYEFLLKNFRLKRQRLLVPYQLTPCADDLFIIHTYIDIFNRNGFEIDGENRLITVPTYKNHIYDINDFNELLESIKSDSVDKTYVCRKTRDIIASKACRSSIMIGTHLKHEDMTSIVQNLVHLRRPWNCPHGRPVMRVLFCS